MGAFVHWVVVKGPVKALRAAGLEPSDSSEARGWRYGDAEGVPDDLAALVARVGAAGPALGAAILDSDEAVVVAAAPGGEPARLDDLDAFVAWADAHAPRRIGANELLTLLARETTFVEEMLFELVDRLGLARAFDETRIDPAPSLDALGLGGLLRPLPDQGAEHFLGGDVWRPWSELPYVPGIGRGFIGIWDRARPAAPVERFPLSRRGRADAEQRLDALLVPVVLAAHDLAELGGYRAPVLGFDQLTPGYRTIEPRDARFVAGRGDGYIGIWDRERPDEPVERFPDTDDGWSDALHRVDALLYDWLAEGTRLPGVRLYRAGELVVEEEPHPAWQPIMPGFARQQRYRVLGPRTLQHTGSAEPAQTGLRPVPEDVPRTLLATGEWVAAQGRM